MATTATFVRKRLEAQFKLEAGLSAKDLGDLPSDTSGVDNVPRTRPKMKPKYFSRRPERFGQPAFIS